MCHICFHCTAIFKCTACYFTVPGHKLQFNLTEGHKITLGQNTQNKTLSDSFETYNPIRKFKGL